MEKKQLLENEEIIYKSNTGFYTLTTHRVRTNLSTPMSNSIVSIMLEKISSIEVAYKNILISLIMGLLFIGIGIILAITESRDSEGAMAFLLIVGAVLVAVFFITRKSTIVISSDGGSKIFISSIGMSADSIIEIIDGIEKAKNNRIISLSKVMAIIE